MRTAIYWGLLGPDDHGRPEIIFRDEKLAHDALVNMEAEHPEAQGLVRLVRLRATFELVPGGE